MSRNRRAPGSILLVTLGAAAGWVGAPAGIAVLSAQTSFGTSQSKSQTSMQKVQPSPKPSMQKAQPSPKEMQFDQARSRAMSGKPPGGNPSGESNAFMERLKRQHESRVESQNARVQAMFGRLSVPPTGGGGKKGPPPGVHAPGTGPAPVKLPDPCEGRPLEIKAIQTTPPLEPGEKVLVDGCGFGYPTDPAPAEVFLFGDGFPGGRLKLDLEGTLPMGILARVPMRQGVPDIKTAKLQVVRGSKFSNQMDVGEFHATRAVRRILPKDISVTCYNISNQAECEVASRYPPGESSFFMGATIGAKHSQSAAAMACGEDSDSALALLGSGWEEHVESFGVNLKNGWTLSHYNWWWSDQGKGYAYAPSGFAQGANSATLTMKWGISTNYCVGPKNSSVRYRVDLYAIGPKGISYN